jgi:uncharacterized membrane protein
MVMKKKGADAHKLIHGRRTVGERAADGVARWAGSWGFILGFFIFLGLWILVNVYAWVGEWDPYPFILLNLALSCLAAIQAPIILMSQNRQAQKDRQRMAYDYQVNKKAEKEIEEMLVMLRKIVRKKK